jgi:hypothetical protein
LHQSEELVYSWRAEQIVLLREYCVSSYELLYPDGTETTDRIRPSSHRVESTPASPLTGGFWV